jgi:hypothetical protein
LLCETQSGHSSVQMSLRYAQLAPDQMREAVSKLNQQPLLRLPCAYQQVAQIGCTYPIDFMVEREGIEPSTPAL